MTTSPPSPMWQRRTPRTGYDVVVVGGGGHGLATAHYLATEHGITDVAVLERGWLGGGNTARNATMIRSNYLDPAQARFFEFSIRRWEQLADELDYDILFDQCGSLTLAHTPLQVHEGRRMVETNQLAGVRAAWLEPDEIVRLSPTINLDPDILDPVMGAALHLDAGIAKHDYVAWGYARQADRAGVELIEDCEVTGLRTTGDRVTAVETTQGVIGAGTVLLAGAGDSGHLAAMAGLRLPLQTRPLQAYVTEILEPVQPLMVTSRDAQVYMSQAHKGELVMGVPLDTYNSYRQRGSQHVIEHHLARTLQVFPHLGRIHLIRSWAGAVDLTPDGSPLIGLADHTNLFLNAGWGTGGFKATPAVGWALADSIAHGRMHPLVSCFDLHRTSSPAVPAGVLAAH